MRVLYSRPGGCQAQFLRDFADHPTSHTAHEQLLGGSPAEFPARYRQASAAGLLPIGTRQEVLIGGKLPAQWIEAMKSYATAAKSAGDPLTVTMMENVGHFDGLNPKAPAWATVVASIQSIVEKQ